MPPGSPWPGSPPARGRRGLALGLGVLGVLVVLVIVLVVGLVRSGTTPPGSSADSGPSSGAGTAAGTGGTALRPSSVTATCTTTGTDASGAPQRYDATNAVDGATDTAWRCDGSVLAPRLTASFGAPLSVGSVGLVPGYLKIDPFDGTDRFVQSPRVATATWTFDDGRTVTQTFDTSATTGRRLQSMAIAPVRTASIVLTIVATVPGTTVGTQGPVTKTSVSEIAIAGTR